MPQLLEWVLTSGCCAHDCQGSLKWSLFAHYGDVVLLKDAHIAIESLRNSYTQLYEHFAAWLVDVVKWVDDPCLAEELHT
eukprot:8727359-Lingulodinium_polyedra.AAC.1